MDSSQNAMTEIALALAMGFFSIMVLTMVSMGAGTATQTAKAQTTEAIAAKLAPASKQATAAAKTAPKEEDRLVVYAKGQFLDKDLKEIDPATISGPGRVILAFEPSIAMNEAMSVRARLNVENLIVSTLDEKWMAALGRDVQ